MGKFLTWRILRQRRFSAFQPWFRIEHPIWKIKNATWRWQWAHSVTAIMLCVFRSNWDFVTKFEILYYLVWYLSQTDGQTDGKRRIWAHRAIRTGGLNKPVLSSFFNPVSDCLVIDQTPNPGNCFVTNSGIILSLTEPQKHPSFTFCLRFLLIHELSKIWTNFFHLWTFYQKVLFRFFIAHVLTDLAPYIASVLKFMIRFGPIHS